MQPSWHTNIHHLTTTEVVESLHSNITGLSSVEAERRLSEFGANVIEKVYRKPLLLRFASSFTHFFAIILWCGAAIAFFAQWKDPVSNMAPLGFAIIGVIVINAVFSFWQEFRAEQAINALQKLIPHNARAMRDGKLLELPASALVPGDVIVLEDGNDVSADCRIIEAFGLRVNNATITGEALPQSRNTEPSREEDIIRSKNVLLAGTQVYQWQAKAIVFATGMYTEFGKIAKLTMITTESLSPLQKEIVRLSRVIAIIALSVGIVFYLLGLAKGIGLWEDAIFALGIIVALVPEGLLPEVTLALATCSKRMARRNALVRHLPSVETLGCATVICTDKTGTLTKNQMTVKKVFVGGELFDGDRQLEQVTANTDLNCLCEIAINCQDIKQVEQAGKQTMLGDPTEVALVEYGHKIIPELPATVKVDEIPFDSDRKRLSIIHQIASGWRIYTKGALETLLPLCQTVRMRGFTQGLSESMQAQFVAAQDEMTREGLRVLAFAFKDMEALQEHQDLEDDLCLVGLVGLYDPPRKEVPDAMKKCREAGIKVIMITGDHPNTACAIGYQIGLLQSASPKVITGPQLRKMPDPQLQLLLDCPEILFARTDASQKMRIVEALKRKKHIVAVTGDGVNDAPALKAADIGIAMGLSGTDVAREAACLVIADDNFASIVNAIEEGRTVFANIRKFLTYVLSSNIAELVPCLAFVLLHVPLPLTVLQILSVDLGTDIFPALALGAEKPDHQVMKQPPRSNRERLFDLPLLLRAYLFLGVMVSVGSMSFYFYVLRQGGWHWGQNLPPGDLLYQQATSACLAGIICMQMMNAFMCRSDRRSIFSLGFFSNPMLLSGICSEIILLLIVVYTPFGNSIFHTASLPIHLWLFILPFMIWMMLTEEFRKLLVYVIRLRRNKDMSPSLLSSETV